MLTIKLKTFSLKTGNNKKNDLKRFSKKFEKEINEVKNEKINGINVTVPYKKSIISFLLNN